MRLFGRYMHPFRKALSREASALAWDMLGYPTYTRAKLLLLTTRSRSKFIPKTSHSISARHSYICEQLIHVLQLLSIHIIYRTSKCTHYIYTGHQRSWPTNIASIAAVAGQESLVRRSLPLQAQRTEEPDVREQRLQQQTE